VLSGDSTKRSEESQTVRSKVLTFGTADDKICSSSLDAELLVGGGRQLRMTKDKRSSWEAKRRRLQLAREHAGFKSARQAALAMGWVYPTYASHENGLRDIPQKVAEKYARAFRVSPEYIMFGINPPDWAKEETKPDMIEVAAPTRPLPFFEDTDAAPLRDWLKKGHAPRPQFFISDPGNISAKTIAVKITTDEMRAKPPTVGEREILPGDTAIIDAERKNVRPGDVVAVLIDGDPYIHIRKVVMSGGKQVFYALNRDHGEYEKAEVVGRVMWVMSGF